MTHAALALATALLLASVPTLADDAGAPKPTPPKPAAPAKPAAAKPGAPSAPGKGAKPGAPKPEAKRPDEDSFDDDAKPGAAPSATSTPAPTPTATAGPVRPLDVHTAPPPDQSFTYRQPVIIPTLAWLGSQLLPSPEIVIGRQRTIAADGTKDGGPGVTWGIRWQITPLLWSWGVHRKQSRWRTLIVDPLARVSGSIEVWTAIEYIGGEISRPLVRPGVRGYFPLIDRGEYLAASFGTSIYAYDNDLRVAYDVGLYAFSGIFGVIVTVAPSHAPMTSIITFNLRYF